MKEKGLMIDKEGICYPFGTHGGNETLASGHKLSFEKDVVDQYFKKLNLNYDKGETVYTNAESLSREGNIMIFNRRLNAHTSTQILAYMPINPTVDQLDYLKLIQEELDKTELKAIHELHPTSINYSDATDYSSILEYINKKTQNLSKKDIQSKGKIIK